MNIIKKSFLVFFTVGLLFFVSFIKSEVRNLRQETTTVLKTQENLEENIQVLEAEYAYLTSPARLADISEKLNLKTIEYNSTTPQLVSLKYRQPE